MNNHLTSSFYTLLLPSLEYTGGGVKKIPYSAGIIDEEGITICHRGLHILSVTAKAVDFYYTYIHIFMYIYPMTRHLVSLFFYFFFSFSFFHDRFVDEDGERVRQWPDNGLLFIFGVERSWTIGYLRCRVFPQSVVPLHFHR